MVSVLALALFLLAYYLLDNTILTIIVSIGIVFFVKALEPYIILLQFKLFPMPQIKKVRELNMSELPGQGVRIMVVTEFTEFDNSDKNSLELYDSIVERAVEKLKEEKPLFALRYNKVCEDKLPMQYTYSVCGAKNSGTRKCYRAWLKFIDEKAFGVWKENSELFLHDDFFEDPASGEQRRSLVLFMFDSRLPKALKNSDEAPGAEAKA